MIFPSFSQTLAGYTASDTSVPLVKAVASSTGRYGKTYRATGDYLVRLGDPVDPNDKVGPKNGRDVLADLAFGGYGDGNGTYTHVTLDGLAYGAYLERRGVELERGEGIWFRYAFIANDFFDNNDCAVVLAYDDRHNLVAARRFYDLIGLFHDNRFGAVKQTLGWQPFFWRPVPGGAFTGTVRWALLNGQLRDTQNDPPDGRLNTNLSCLLLDTVEVRDTFRGP